MGADGLDQWDLQILEALQEDGRQSYRAIGSALGIAAGTVRSRVLQMVADGVVEIVAVPNPHRMGLVPATIGIRVTPGQIGVAADVLAKLEVVSWVALTANGYDVMIEVALDDMSAFSGFKDWAFASVPGFVSADVFLHTEYKKLRYRLSAAGTDQEPGGGNFEPSSGRERRVRETIR